MQHTGADEPHTLSGLPVIAAGRLTKPTQYEAYAVIAVEYPSIPAHSRYWITVGDMHQCHAMT